MSWQSWNVICIGLLQFWWKWQNVSRHSCVKKKRSSTLGFMNISYLCVYVCEIVHYMPNTNVCLNDVIILQETLVAGVTTCQEVACSFLHACLCNAPFGHRKNSITSIFPIANVLDEPAFLKIKLTSWVYTRTYCDNDKVRVLRICQGRAR